MPVSFETSAASQAPVLSAAFEVGTSTGGYAVRIGPGLVEEALSGDGDRLLLADGYFGGRFATAGVDVVTLEAGEDVKSLDAIPALVSELRRRGMSRQTLLLAVGGGAIQDVAGFVASVYMRGVRWTYMPTTLLGMVDSCIGGKSSINVGGFKNLVGTFYPPQAVLIDPVFCDSLETPQRVAGLCEAAKICFARGPETFEAYLAICSGARASREELAGVIELSLRCKKWFVEIDEFDRGERLLLNFGHTFGHALEAASQFRLGHGVAVGIGMLAAIELAAAVHGSAGTSPRVRPLGHHVRALLSELPDRAALVGDIKIDALLEAFGSDKKHTRDRFWLVIPDLEGRLQQLALPRNANSRELITSAFQRALETFTR